MGKHHVVQRTMQELSSMMYAKAKDALPRQLISLVGTGRSGHVAGLYAGDFVMVRYTVILYCSLAGRYGHVLGASAL